MGFVDFLRMALGWLSGSPSKPAQPVYYDFSPVVELYSDFSLEVELFSDFSPEV
jgi:hypothetical protein